WRHARSLERTKLRRPDLLGERAFTHQERAVLNAAPSSRPKLELAAILEDASPEPLVRVALAYDVAKLHLIADRAPSIAGEPIVLHSGVEAFARALEARRSSLLVAVASPSPPSTDIAVVSARELSVRA